MEQLTRAGVPLLEGIADIRDSTDHPRFKEIIANVISNVEGGMLLSQAMAEHAEVFDVLFVNLVRAGETTGQLAEVFKNLTETLKWQDELAAQAKKILMYPAFVGTVVLGVTLFLMIYLVPQLVGFIKNMGQEIPLHTRALIAVSNFFVHYWWLVIGLPPLVFFSVTALARANPRVRYQLDDFKLKVWLIGPVLRRIILSRFANFFAMMYAAGIPILEALRVAEGISGNKVIEEAIQRAGSLISEGQGFTASFEQTGMFPRLVLRMLRIGETTGSLDGALLNVSYFYDREVKELIGQLQSMIEPIMTVVLGLILGWVMLSVLGPIYDTISKLKI
jgi:type IV pilus assembly protein PilC